jgi:hypothetical protein
MRIYPRHTAESKNGSGLVKGMDKVGEISEDDIKVMMDTNVTGLINVLPPSRRLNGNDRIDDSSGSSIHEET